jgi:hypothetical protein
MNKELSVWCEVVCDICGKHGRGAWYKSPNTIKNIRADAIEDGWKESLNRTMCPACFDDYITSFAMLLSDINFKTN